MKLKIYLRGLGIGIVVTALILGISGGKKEMSDAEVIARAKKLGMVEGEAESGKLSQSFGAEKIETEEYSTEEMQTIETESVPPTESDEETLQQETKDGTEITQQSEAQKETKAAEKPETDDEVKAAEQTVKVTIVSGDDSAAASRRIYEAGLVESAADLDKYLCSNGYSQKVVSGTYEIPVDSDNETIAKIITKNR